MTNVSNQEDKVIQIAEEEGWSEVELQHALENIDNDYGVECVVKLANGRELRTPAYPEDCSYVRITHNGYEIAYWISDEWAEDPEIVMGAIVGCMQGN